MLTHLFCILEFREIKLVKDLAQKKCVCGKGICLQTEGKVISAKPSAKEKNPAGKLTGMRWQPYLFSFLPYFFSEVNLHSAPWTTQSSPSFLKPVAGLAHPAEVLGDPCCQGSSMVWLPGGTTCGHGMDICQPLGSPRSVPTSGGSKDRARVQICSQIW